MLLIIGFDGATWDIIDPLIEQGRLPNLARLRSAGVSGPLASTTPPITFPAWTSFMTGVNPGKHGVFDFTRRDLGTYRVRFVNSTFRKAKTVWAMLSEHGKRVCVLGLPGTYPPEPINGCMVSGFDTPVTTRANRSFVWPLELFAEIEAAGGFPFADFQEFRISEGWYEGALEALHRGIDTKVRLARRLIQRESWDCFFLLFGESDTVAHHFWRFHDPDSPGFDPQASDQLKDAINAVYQHLDAALGALWGESPDAEIMVVSDHGFGRTGSKAIHLNSWLSQAGFLERERTTLLSRGLAAVKGLALESIPRAVQPWLFRTADYRFASLLESRVRFAGIRWLGTRAFSEELNYFPSIWVNLRGREPQGQVDPVDYERVRSDLCAAVMELRDPVSGSRIVQRAWRREELYQGEWVRYAPDIVLEYHLDAGSSYLTMPSFRGASSFPVAQLDVGAVGKGKLHGMSGSHRPQGVVLLAGRRIAERGRICDARIEDAAPTILSLCGLDSPKEFDGRTLILSVDRFLTSVDRQYEPSAECMYGPGEEDEVAERLSGLGYLA